MPIVAFTATPRPEVNSIYKAGIFPENAASLALPAAPGFRLVGRRGRIAQLAGIVARYPAAGAPQPHGGPAPA